ncbi:hypothetical protein J5N97_026315 [Dioscorea zingiberensis]|uniref:DUF7797 domain-containing protein n=1 Tax=Dioscorea zingiberensis TaxID=325984 RepID=A0A9D5H6P6_9LILI|nr:hypothetical protein J5N97_026315 [Dioscorea zingiberensis]
MRDLKRVAEIVMVLSTMGEMRAGGVPSAVEKSLVAEAREKLAKACEIVKPRDLFSREAVRVLVEDLGLNRSRDPMSGFRPPKTSIAEKLLLTKRKVPSSMSVAQASTERKSETSDSKINDQIPNGNSTFLVHASTTGSNLGDSVPDLKTDETKEIHDMDFSIQTKMEDGMCSGTTSDHSKEVTAVECVKLGPDRGSLDEKNETTRLSPSEMQKSNSESLLQMKAEDSSSLHDEIIKSSDIACPSNINDICKSICLAVYDSQFGKNLDVQISFEASADLHGASKSNMDESEELSKSCESSKGNADSENMKDDIDILLGRLQGEHWTMVM